MSKFKKSMPPYIIAELSTNHKGSFLEASRLIEAAANCGVNAIKIQTYTADSMTLNVKNKHFKIRDKNNLWYGYYLYDLYKKGSTPYIWHKKIFDKAKSLGLDYFSSPFDINAVDFLESLNVKMYKIASFEITDLKLIEKIASTKKTTFISTGMATKKEIFNAIKIFKKKRNNKYILLKCTSNYPADPSDSNILTIEDMKKKFKCPVGISDHTLGIGVPLASVALGAQVVEKHFKLKSSFKKKALDDAFSLNPEQMSQLVRESKNVWKSIGKISYGPTNNEKKSLIFRRSLFAKKDINKGDLFTSDNIGIFRPNIGLQPKEFDKIIGKKSKKSIKKGSPLFNSHF
tara:strand:+ start:111 stop:1145 length:1035 start_codon:yes stop_codon:yes gene_type:complete